jgi:serine/threonine-protein kinase HipA
MTDRAIQVFVDVENTTHHVGQLWVRNKNGRESASFQYENTWLQNPDCFAIEPALNLDSGTFHTPAGHINFGAIGDSAPDRWGRMLIRRAAAQRTREDGQASRTLDEIDYLLAVNDETRQGALRFALDINGPFIANYKSSAIPPLIDLPKLLSATENVINDQESDADLRLLLAPGASLGGARPKASVINKDGTLAIAKFPRTDDEYSIVLWEAVALSLAAKAKIQVPEWKVVELAERSVILINRFDRIGSKRIPFLSAMSLLGAHDNEQHSYLELVDAIKQYGSNPKQDILELWRRIVFSILISNTDDHLRNHGMLYTQYKGWRLSPIYDVNPTPVEIKPRILTTMINLDDSTASLQLAFSVIHEFDLKLTAANIIVSEVAKAVAQWRKVAAEFKISSREISRMASAFEHQDLKQALAL